MQYYYGFNFTNEERNILNPILNNKDHELNSLAENLFKGRSLPELAKIGFSKESVILTFKEPYLTLYALNRELFYKERELLKRGKKDHEFTREQLREIDSYSFFKHSRHLGYEWSAYSEDDIKTFLFDLRDYLDLIRENPYE